MKIFKINFFWILVATIVLSVVVLLPSLMIQSLWNSLFENHIETNLMISVWQAALLWGALLTAIYMSGLIKFKLDVKTLDNIDLSEIQDPQLRAEIERLRKMQESEDEKDSDEK